MDEKTAAAGLLLVGLAFTWFVSRKSFRKGPLFLALLSVGVVYTAGNVAGHGDAGLIERAMATLAYGACVAGVWYLAGGARR